MRSQLRTVISRTVHRHGSLAWNLRSHNANNLGKLLLGQASGKRLAHTVSTTLAGRPLVLEAGRIGPLADAVVFAKYGNTSMLVSAVSANEVSPEDFLPLQVDYRERAFAYGQIPLTSTRREPNMSDRETLAARIIDRTIRPLFPEGYLNETQLIATLLSHDSDADPAMLSIIASSAALQISSIPWDGPAAAVRVGFIEGNPVVCPTASQMSASALDLLYAGTFDSKTLMIEVASLELPEKDMIRSFRHAHAAVEPLLYLQNEFRLKVGKNKHSKSFVIPSDEMVEAVKEAIFDDAKRAFSVARTEKSSRSLAQARLIEKGREKGRAILTSNGVPDTEIEDRQLSIAAESIVRAAMRAVVTDAAFLPSSTLHHVNPLTGRSPDDATLASIPSTPSTSTPSELDGSTVTKYSLYDAEGCRVDGRSTRELRTLRGEVDVVPLTHGSAVFSRGDTQVLAVATLGPVDMALEESEAGFQTVRPARAAPVGEQSKRFMLHYDFPPYATDEMGKLGGVNRRSIGHGALAEKAFHAVFPSEEAFPYVARVLGETTGSDGSSSMATICATTLSLLDAGVPLKAPVAGISIGAITTADKPGGMQLGDPYTLLTDIFGLEDHTGDMDFKVAGTHEGITAIQLDIKPAGLPLEVLEQAVWRAKDARTRILDMMSSVQKGPRTELKETAPRVEILELPPELRSKLIGPAGSNLRHIESLTGARLVLDSDAARLSVYGTKQAMADAKELIQAAVQEQLRAAGSPLGYNIEPSKRWPTLIVGVPVEAVVLKINEFGVVLGVPGLDINDDESEPKIEDLAEAGWMHISEFAKTRTAKVTDLLDEGDKAIVQVCDVDARGRGKFSIRALLGPNEEPDKYITRKGGNPRVTLAAVKEALEGGHAVVETATESAVAADGTTTPPTGAKSDESKASSGQEITKAQTALGSTTHSSSITPVSQSPISSASTPSTSSSTSPGIASSVLSNLSSTLMCYSYLNPGARMASIVSPFRQLQIEQAGSNHHHHHSKTKSQWNDEDRSARKQKNARSKSGKKDQSNKNAHVSASPKTPENGKKRRNRNRSASAQKGKKQKKM